MKDLHIIIVDDNENNLFTLNCVLEEAENIQVSQAQSGADALKIIEKEEIDLAIVDVQMPEMNGFELANILEDRESEIPVIFLTAFYKTEEFESRGYKLGAFDYLTKPIDEHRLLNKIHLYSKLHRKQEELKKANRELTKTIQELKDAQNEIKRLSKSNANS